MDILSLFIVVPLITVLALVFANGLKQSRIISMIGSIVQLGMAINLVFAYFKERVFYLPKIIKEKEELFSFLSSSSSGKIPLGVFWSSFKKKA